MNKYNAKNFLPLVKALSEGKTLQVKVSNDEWEDREEKHEFFFTMSPDRYRVKPEPRIIWQVLEGDRVAVQLSSARGFTYEVAEAKRKFYQQRYPGRNYTLVTFVEQIEENE